MNYAESTRYLISLGNEIRAAGAEGVLAAKLGLENITALLGDLGNPQHSFPSVLIAGTNGKGSVSAMVEAILRSAGLRTAHYTSPHLVELTERIRVAGEEISQPDFAAHFTRRHDRIEGLLASGGLKFHPTYFECLTALAMQHFRESQVDIAVLEVGMGGRLDATNTVLPRVSVITQIDLDHERFLGSTIAAIAGEKAGIIKPGGVAVTSAAHPDAAEVIRRRARECGARLVEVSRDYTAIGRELGEGLFQLTVSDRAGWSVEAAPSLRGEHQVENALAAIATVRELAPAGFRVPDAAIARGLAATRWPGRLERVSENPPAYLDGAHNPAGARALAAFWAKYFSGRPIILVYGAMRDKAIAEIADLLFPRAQAVILTQPQQERAASPEAIRELGRHLNPRIRIEPSPHEAMRQAQALALTTRPEGVVFATGSLFLVGDLRRLGYR